MGAEKATLKPCGRGESTSSESSSVILGKQVSQVQRRQPVWEVEGKGQRMDPDEAIQLKSLQLNDRHLQMKLCRLSAGAASLGHELPESPCSQCYLL